MLSSVDRAIYEKNIQLELKFQEKFEDNKEYQKPLIKNRQCNGKQTHDDMLETTQKTKD